MRHARDLAGLTQRKLHQSGFAPWDVGPGDALEVDLERMALGSVAT